MTIYSCPDCHGDLQPDSSGPADYCAHCQRTVPYAVLQDGDDDD